MNRTLFKWQLISAAILLFALFVEWSFTEFSRGELQEILNQTIAADYQAEPLPSLEQPKQLSGNFMGVVERPLFIEGRKPLAETVETGVETAAETGQIDDWLLIGIYNRDKRQWALFRKQNEAKKFLKLNEQQMISGWRLKQIQFDRVILQQGAQEKALMLRKPREQGKIPEPAKRPPPPVKAVQPNVTPPNNNPSENINNDG